MDLYSIISFVLGLIRRSTLAGSASLTFDVRGFRQGVLIKENPTG
ncbi:uncharacterized protein Dana_GF27635 [Drosophila ananassae]|uniref:Uncharacterized protein n=1 Tax=Drosophila ananassae TaxID=7217 RepID=A0A0N8P0T9_DROAN|nr:uncharacterized protein Dana_GF27635 [Drosophila ananassae]